MNDFRYFHYKPGAENWVEHQSSLSIASSNPIYMVPILTSETFEAKTFRNHNSNKCTALD